MIKKRPKLKVYVWEHGPIWQLIIGPVQTGRTIISNQYNCNWSQCSTGCNCNWKSSFFQSSPVSVQFFSGSMDQTFKHYMKPNLQNLTQPNSTYIFHKKAMRTYKGGGYLSNISTYIGLFSLYGYLIFSWCIFPLFSTFSSLLSTFAQRAYISLCLYLAIILNIW